jgi:hypothetical protein
MDLFRRNTKPPPADAARKGMFRAKTTENLETVRAKLAAVNEEVARLEADADRVALAAALDDNPSTGFAAISSLQEARARRDMLQRAEVAALAAENARLAALRSAADKARDRALAQHAGVMEREAAVIEDACAALQQSFTRAAAAQAASLALLPAKMRQEFSGTLGLMTVHCLRQLVEEELGRLGRGSLAPLVPRFAAPHERRHDGFIPPLVETIKTVTSLRHRLSPIPEVAASPPAADALAPAELQPSVGGDAASDDLEGKESEAEQTPASSTSPAYTEASESF